jgi:hypothetical protein
MPGVEGRADIEKTALKAARRLRYKVSIPKFRHREGYLNTTISNQLTAASPPKPTSMSIRSLPAAPLRNLNESIARGWSNYLQRAPTLRGLSSFTRVHQSPSEIAKAMRTGVYNHYSPIECYGMLIVSDGARVDASFVIALCPNCHRRLHADEDGEIYNSELLILIGNNRVRVTACYCISFGLMSPPVHAGGLFQLDGAAFPFTQQSLLRQWHQSV